MLLTLDLDPLSAGRCLAVAVGFLFSWSSVVAEALALVVGYSALQALKCCCWPDRCEKQREGGCRSRSGRTGLAQLVFHTQIGHSDLYLRQIDHANPNQSFNPSLFPIPPSPLRSTVGACLERQSHSSEHRLCLTLLKAYGALSGILAISDLLSFGAIAGQVTILF